MIDMAAIIFGVSAGLISFAYVGYPVLVGLLARLSPEPLAPRIPVPRAVSIVVAAFNEANVIQRRVRELLCYIDGLNANSEIIVVSDGSTDGTDRLVREIGDARVRVVQLQTNSGKAVALNTGVAAARTPLVIFADARQEWSPQTIDRLLASFADPDVGAVSGDLELRNSDGTLAGVGLYWRLEKWIRTQESRLHSSVQVSGSISAVRRELYVPLPAGIILDDMCWPLSVVMQGFRVIHDPSATAYDRLPDKPRDEMRRKVRTLSGNLQLLVRRPAIVLPWANPVWFAVLSHKLLRLVVPWAMLAALWASALSAEPWLRVMFWAQVAGYGVAILGMSSRTIARSRLVSAASSLLVLNTAALFAWFVYFTGRAGRSWKKTNYAPSASSVPTGS